MVARYRVGMYTYNDKPLPILFYNENEAVLFAQDKYSYDLICIYPALEWMQEFTDMKL